MKIQAIISAVALLAIFPLGANAQGNNINVNLNDVMVGQRVQDMSRLLNDANASSAFRVRQHRQKHEQKKKDQRAALLQPTCGQKNMNDEATLSASAGEKL